jgi:hypothetical protein
MGAGYRGSFENLASADGWRVDTVFNEFFFGHTSTGSMIDDHPAFSTTL